MALHRPVNDGAGAAQNHVASNCSFDVEQTACSRYVPANRSCRIQRKGIAGRGDTAANISRYAHALTGQPDVAVNLAADGNILASTDNVAADFGVDINRLPGAKHIAVNDAFYGNG